MPDHVDTNGNLVLDGDGEKRGRGNLEIGQGGWDCAFDVVGGALDDLGEGDVGVVRGVAGELDFEVAVERGGCEGGLGQSEADGDERELCTAGDLKHVEVAIGVAGVEGLDGNGEEEIALAAVADAFSFGGVTYTIDLMNGMGHVIGEGGLIEKPCAVWLGLIWLGLVGLGEQGRREKESDEEP
jgi:hypothetical protein